MSELSNHHAKFGYNILRRRIQMHSERTNTFPKFIADESNQVNLPCIPLDFTTSWEVVSI